MLSKNIKFKNFQNQKTNIFLKKKFLSIFKDIKIKRNQIMISMSKEYKDSYSVKIIRKLRKFKMITLIGMGGSVLGAKAIYNFCKSSKNKFFFIENFFPKKLEKLKNNLFLIISKSGSTLETISNQNISNQNNSKKIFITENKESYLRILANKSKSEIINHNNLIGGRYSVFSEVGMFPAQLMGLNPKKFRILDKLIKNKKFINCLIDNSVKIAQFQKKKKTNSIIINYDYNSNDLFYWYQQLVAESLGKNKSGILPTLSVMPRDNHSLMQYYLDGVENHFFTLFFVKEKNSPKLKNNQILHTHNYLKNKSINDIAFSQFKATEKVLKSRNIPFRSFVVDKRDEMVLAELFIFFILETILLGKFLKIDPFDQPAVELIKKDTIKILKKI
jgi:glucose-6-phosphate isomerase